MPNPPSSTAGTARASADLGIQMDANMHSVDTVSATPDTAYNERFPNSGPIRLARAAHRNIVAIITRSNASWPATEAAGNRTNEPTNTISIHARYTPSPRKNSGMDGSHGSSGPGAVRPPTVPSSHAGASASRTPTASSSAKRSSALSRGRSNSPDPFVSPFSIASNRRAALVGTPSPVFRWFTILAKLSPYAQGAPHLDQSLDPSLCLLNDGMIGKDDENNPRFPTRGRTTGARHEAMVRLEGFA